jgi:RecB family endonuclease NucS
MTDDRRLGKTRAEARLFRYERELQDAIRRQLTQVEPGLVEADGGHERSVATGKIDVLARDLAGHFVVIELKVGPCPHGALEQVLAYSDRIRAAAKRARDISLVTYELQLGLAEVLPQPR